MCNEGYQLGNDARSCYRKSVHLSFIKMFAIPIKVTKGTKEYETRHRDIFLDQFVSQTLILK